MWTWKQSCGDPHAATHGGEPPLPPWNVFEMDCSDGGNRIVGMNRPLVRDLRRGYVRRAPGRIDATRWNVRTRVLTASGDHARPKDGPLELWFPGSGWSLRGTNLGRIAGIRELGVGTLLRIRVVGGRWDLTMRRR